VTERNIPVPGIAQNTPANSNYNGGFSTRLISKDLNLAMQLIDRLGLSSTELAKTSCKIFEELDNSEYSGKDFSVVYKYISDLNGVRE
jgi:3-hydroxyisobutyrate dehydrogenase-like beta-hydroxyacid dehydrogenase